MTIRLDWDANPSSELVTGYQVFESVNGGTMTLIATTPNNFYEILNPLPGVYAFAIKAVNFVGVSEISDTVTGPGVPSKPTTPVITIM